MPDNIANPSNIATLIGGIMESKNRIKTKLLDLGLAAANDSLYDLSYEITDIANNGAISATVQEGTSYTIPAGYHNGAGVVTGISGGGNYQLQAKGPITPTKSQQQITSDEGYYGLSGVTIDPIPDAYQDVSSVTAQASQVLATKIFVNSAGNVVTGTMTNNGAVNQTISVATPSYTIPSGYHNGSGKVSIVTETKTITPSTSTQDVTPTSGKVLSKVTVKAMESGEFSTSDEISINPAITVNNSGIVSVSYSNIVNTTPVSTVGYFGATASYKPTISIDSSLQLSTQTGTTITPTKSEQTAVAAGKYTTGVVKVAAIPSAYQDVTGVTAAASQVLAGTSFVTSDGTLTAGTMTNQGAISKVLDANGSLEPGPDIGTKISSYIVPSGYHNGSGIVKIVLEEKSATPSTSSQNITPTSGRVLSKVTVAAIPSAYQDVTGVTATASQVLAGASYVTAAGVLTTGTMANVGAQVSAIDGLTVASKLITQGYHDGTGYVYLTNDIEIALSSI